MTAVTFVAGQVPAAPSEISLPGALQILGNVRNAARPVANALVIALNLNSFATTQTWTSSDGKFSMPPLENGIYKVIAVKSGFAPAIATVMPAKKSEHRVTLRLETQSKSKTRDDEIWEIRGSLPPDVLREIDNVLAGPVKVSASYDVPRLRGQMMSVTGMSASQGADTPAFAQTGIGVQSRIGDSWQIGIRGDMQRFDNPTSPQAFGDPVAQSNAMSMELRPSATDSVRVTSSRSTWRYVNSLPDEDGGAADLRSHNLEWDHGSTTVKVHYFAHDNFFRPAFASDVIEVAGDTPILQTQRNDLDVSLRVRQESVRANNADVFRTANLAANGALIVAPILTVHYGMASRIGYDRTEWAPATGAEWKITKNTALIGSMSYKVIETNSSAVLLPSLVAWSDDGAVLPRYTYSFGMTSARDDNNRFSIVATVTAADAPMRLVIGDSTQQFWDTLAVDTGDIRRDVRIAYRHDFGSHIAFDIATSAGTATPRQYTDLAQQKVYVTGDVQAIFTPTRTTLAIAYRGIEQPQALGEYRSGRVNVRVAQSLYLPIDMNVLVGVELVRAENSPYLLDNLQPEETSRKYIAGLALNF